MTASIVMPIMRGAFVGCLTARRRNDPKQAGLSNQCALRRVMGIDDESDQV
jgi:hypothetical protein